MTVIENKLDAGKARSRLKGFVILQVTAHPEMEDQHSAPAHIDYKILAAPGGAVYAHASQGSLERECRRILDYPGFEDVNLANGPPKCRSKQIIKLALYFRKLGHGVVRRFRFGVQVLELLQQA